jgi:hypothetical protein
MTAAGVIGLKCLVSNPGFATGDTVRWSVWVRPSSTISIQPYFERTTPTYVGGGGGSAVSCPAGQWTQLVGSITLTSAQADPSGSFGFGFLPTTSWAATDYFYADEIIVERNLGTLSPYYDGGTAASGDYTYAWSGAANASTSYQQAPALVGVGAGNAAVYQSSAWNNSRGHSLRITPTSPSSMDSCAYVHSLVPAGGWQSGVTYTVSATVYLPAAQTGSLDGAHRDRRIVVYHDNVSTMSSQPANAAGATRVSVTFTLTDATVYLSLRLYNGTLAGGGDVWWDDILIETSTSSGTYFDGTTAGSTVATYSPPGTWSYGWTGGADASTSTATLSIPLQDWSVQLPDGTIIGPGPDATVPVLLESITGLLQLVSGRGAPTARGQGDGTTPTLNFAGDRVVNIGFGAYNPPGGMRPALLPLARAFTRIKDPSKYVMTSGGYLNQQAVGGSLPVSALQVKIPGVNQLILLGYPEASGTPIDAAYSYGEAHVATQWVVPDGLLYESAMVQSATVGLATATSGATFPATFNLAFGASSSNSMQVTNGGLYDAAPLYKITGPVTNPRIVNALTGQFIQINLVLGSGDVLVVDTQSKVVRLNGVNRNTAVAGGSQWFLLPPGSSTLQFASTDGASVAGTLTAYLFNTYSTL